MNKFCLLALSIWLLQSCVAVKEYEKVNLNDPDMALTDKKCEKNISTFHAYREAAVGATAASTGGGCGCN